MNLENEPKSFKALIPFLTFLFLYLFVGVWLTIQGQEFAFYQFPAPSCALVGFGVALAMGWRNVHGHVQTFTRGVGEETVILMCLIFLLAGAFSSLTKAMGAVDSTVNLGLYLLPDQLILPGLFLIACFVSLAMGTSMGTIGTIVPIAIGIAEVAGINLALTVGTVLSGSIFGDNLSIISDTTIAATGTQGCQMRDKMLSNLKIALPAAAVVLGGLLIASQPTQISQDLDFQVIKTIPYLSVLVLALTGVNVIAVLMIGIGVAAGIGLATGAFAWIEIGKIAYNGFDSMAEVFFMTVLVAGLAALATEQGGLNYILHKLTRLVTGRRSAEAGIASLVSLADICIANNTVAIVVTGSMAKKISETFKIPAPRAASLLDIFSCVWQGLIPYGAQLLLAGGLSLLSPFSIIPYAWYPMALAAFGLASIALQWPREELVTQPA